MDLNNKARQVDLERCFDSQNDYFSLEDAQKM